MLNHQTIQLLKGGKGFHLEGLIGHLKKDIKFYRRKEQKFPLDTEMTMLAIVFIFLMPTED